MRWAAVPLLGRFASQSEPAAALDEKPCVSGSPSQAVAAQRRDTDAHAPHDTQLRRNARTSGRCHDSAESVHSGSGAACAALVEPLADHPRYQKLADINRGACGFVQLARDTATGEPVAVKFLPRGAGFNAQSAGRELLNQHACAGHSHVVQLQEVFLTEQHLAVVMEFCDGGNVSQHIDRERARGAHGLPEGDARALFQQLLAALDYCHRLGIANRDVKLDNLLLHGGPQRPTLKVCDFGYSRADNDSLSKSSCGTPEYMAPEVLFEDHYDGKAADVWSAGVALYVMLCGDFPFKRPGDQSVPKVVALQRMFGRIVRAEYPPLQRVSEDARELLGWMLQPEVAMRAQLHEIMASDWFRTDLPPGLAALNAECEQRLALWGASGDFGGGRCAQSPEQLLDVVAAAARS